MEGQLEGDPLHPLLLPSVITVLVENIHSSDLAACQLVCKTWNHAVRKKTSVLLNPRVFSVLVRYLNETSILPCRKVCWYWNHRIVNSWRWRDSDMFSSNWDSFFSSLHGFDSVERFTDKFGSPDSYPMGFAFSRLTVLNHDSLSERSTREFINTYGRFVKSMSLYRCKWTLQDLRLVLRCAGGLESLKITCGILPGTQIGKGKTVSVPELECVLHEDPADFPVLKFLRYMDLDINILDSSDRVRPYVEQFFNELFSSSPNLEVLDFNFTSWYARKWATHYIALNLQLGKLSVLNHLVDVDLELVSNLKAFPLKKLRIRVRYKDLTVDALHSLFRSLKDTLTELQVVFCDYNYTCAYEFPSSKDLRMLKKLELWSFKGGLEFLKDFCSLKELVLGKINLRSQQVLSNVQLVRESLPGVKVMIKDDWEVRVFS